MTLLAALLRATAALALFIFSALLPVGSPARAAAARLQLHGVVLAVSPAGGTIVVRHDPFAGMPSMTMPFRVLPRSRVRELAPGAIIDAEVDLTTEPWTLRRVTSTLAAAVVASPRVTAAMPLHVGDLVPDVAFVDQLGRPFRFGALRGADVVLAFIYTRCADARMCPLISAKFHVLQSAFAHRRAHLVEVTLDPTYDRPAVLARYGATFGADPKRWTLAVGDAGATLDFAARFGIAAFPDPQIGIVHSENTVVIGSDGRIRAMTAEGSWTPSEIVAQVDSPQGFTANPVARYLRRAASGAADLFGGHSDVARDVALGALIAGALAYLGRRLYRAVFTQHV